MLGHADQAAAVGLRRIEVMPTLQAKPSSKGSGSLLGRGDARNLWAAPGFDTIYRYWSQKNELETGWLRKFVWLRVPAALFHIVCNHPTTLSWPSYGGRRKSCTAQMLTHDIANHQNPGHPV